MTKSELSQLEERELIEYVNILQHENTQLHRLWEAKKGVPFQPALEEDHKEASGRDASVSVESSNPVTGNTPTQDSGVSESEGFLDPNPGTEAEE